MLMRAVGCAGGVDAGWPALSVAFSCSGGSTSSGRSCAGASSSTACSTGFSSTGSCTGTGSVGGMRDGLLMRFLLGGFHQRNNMAQILHRPTVDAPVDHGKLDHPGVIRQPQIAHEADGVVPATVVGEICHVGTRSFREGGVGLFVNFMAAWKSARAAHWRVQDFLMARRFNSVTRSSNATSTAASPVARPHDTQHIVDKSRVFFAQQSLCRHVISSPGVTALFGSMPSRTMHGEEPMEHVLAIGEIEHFGSRAARDAAA